MRIGEGNSCSYRNLNVIRAFMKRQCEVQDQEKWNQILTIDFMSTESGTEDGEEVMELPWRSSLDEFFQPANIRKVCSSKTPKKTQRSKFLTSCNL